MPPTPPASNVTIRDVTFTATLEERYLAYALSTITARSLPDVRDGLKPVHRRLLYAMYQLRLDPKSGFKKCARVVGDVIGKYHPHGDSAVYEAMVRLAQSFAVRYPLVEGQGNFGSVDGDNAAAMRYTEARLTDVAMALLQDIESETVGFRPTYDGEESEPLVLPAAFPQLLANGAEGIAVGMATSIPPHNVGELCDALLVLIQSPGATTQRLLKHVQGPDFPTGGVLIEPAESMLQSYETGRGSFRVRAAWAKEDLRQGMYQIVIHEIPYQVQKGRLIEKIAELFRNKKLPLLGNIRDESAEEIRIIIEPKNRTVDAETLMESLFRTTDLEVRASLNLNVLTAQGVPQVMGLKEALQAFLAHRLEVLLNKTNFRLGQIAHRLEVLGGLLICYLNLDEVIHIIREEDEPKQVMMKRFKLSDVQVEAILNMRLRSLRKLEEIEIKREHDGLSAEQKALKALLKEESLQWETIAGEIKDTKKRFGASTALGKRRTAFADAPAHREIDVEAFIEKEPITLFCSRMGWIRAVKGHQTEIDDVKYKDGDEAKFALHAMTTDKLLLFASNGRFYTITCDKIPRGKGHGEPIRLMIDLGNEEDIVALELFEPEKKLLIAANNGKGFLVTCEDVFAQTRAGKQVLNLANGAAATICRPVVGDHAAFIGDNRKLLLVPLSQIPLMKKGAGVALQKYQGGGLSDAKCFALKEGLSWRLGDKVRTEMDVRPWLGNRASAGRLPPNGFPKNNMFE